MIKLGTDQLNAYNTIIKFLKSENVAFYLTGSGGTGKSFLISTIITYLKENKIDYCLCAPTHKAKAVMEYYTKNSAITIHNLLSLSPKLDILDLDFRDLQFKNIKVCDSFPYKGVVICDEASMVNDYLYKSLIKLCKDFKSKIIFIGDKAQLSPVKENHDSLVTKLTNNYQLNKIYRQAENNAIMPILQTLRNEPITSFKSVEGIEGSLYCYSNFKEFFNKCVEGINKSIKEENIFEAKILAYTNVRVNKYNEYLTKFIFGDCEKYHKFEILTGYENLTYNNYSFWNSMDYIIINEPIKIDLPIPYYKKLPAYKLELYDVGKNKKASINILDKNLDLEEFYNLAKIIEEYRLKAVQATRYKGKLWEKYYDIYRSFTTPIDLIYDNRLIRKKSFDRGYATTIHKSQGSSYNNVYIDMNDVNRCKNLKTVRQLQYVSLSRTINNAYIFQ